MKRALAMLTIGASVLLAACSAGSSAGTSLDPFSPEPSVDASPSMDTSPSLESPSGSPDSMSPSASPS